MDSPVITRRGFIQGAGALTFGLLVHPRAAHAAAESAVLSPNALLRIEPDNTVRIVMPHGDMGSGIYTGLAQIMADELDADWRYIVTEHLASLDAVFKQPQWGMIATGGSTSVAGRWDQFRNVAATARAMLVEAAARLWGVDAHRLTTSNSMVMERNGDRRASYGELTARAARLTPPRAVTLKTPDRHTLVGRNVQRLDGPAKASGSAVYSIDFQLPGMLHAAIRHCPTFGGKLKSFDARRAQRMSGVRAVVEIPTGVAVIADSFWQAKTARDVVDLTWDHGAFAHTSSADMRRQYEDLVRRDGPVFEQRGSINMARVARRIEGEFYFPYLAHAPMEPLSATARMTGDACEIWSGTHYQDIDVINLERYAGIDPEKVTITTLWLGGSFGRRASPNGDFLVEAVQIAQASGLDKPVKLIWQREDDIRGGFYRPLTMHRYEIGLDAGNQPVTWKHRIASSPVAAGTPMGAGYDYNGFDLLSITGLVHNQYRVPNVEFQLHATGRPVPVCWLRGEADTHTGPVVEAVVNRLAREAGMDPFAMRRKLIGESAEAARILGVLDALEAASNWREPPPEDVYRGMAVNPAFGSVCGFVVELRKSGTRLDFHKVTAAIDCGRVINPNVVKSQVYGSAAFALSMVNGQQITIAGGQPVESNFHDFPSALMRQVPHVEVHLVDNGLHHPTGVGEVPVPSFIAALTEAVCAATGQTVDSFPMKLEGYTFLDG